MQRFVGPPIELASWWRRVMVWFIDFWVIVLSAQLMAAVILVPMGWLSQQVNAAKPVSFGDYFADSFLSSYCVAFGVAAFFMLIWFPGTDGDTLGESTMRVQTARIVVAPDGQVFAARPTMRLLALRILGHVADSIFAYGFLRASWDPYRQTFGDQLAGLVVIPIVGQHGYDMLLPKQGEAVLYPRVPALVGSPGGSFSEDVYESEAPTASPVFPNYTAPPSWPPASASTERPWQPPAEPPPLDQLMPPRDAEPTPIYDGLVGAHQHDEDEDQRRFKVLVFEVRKLVKLDEDENHHADDLIYTLWKEVIPRFQTGSFDVLTVTLPGADRSELVNVHRLMGPSFKATYVNGKGITIERHEAMTEKMKEGLPGFDGGIYVHLNPWPVWLPPLRPLQHGEDPVWRLDWGEEGPLPDGRWRVLCRPKF